MMVNFVKESYALFFEVIFFIILVLCAGIGYYITDFAKLIFKEADLGSIAGIPGLIIGLIIGILINIIIGGFIATIINIDKNLDMINKNIKNFNENLEKISDDITSINNSILESNQ
ncbi:MAG: hypothetical protein LBB56_03665 [Chitinispirillales bacterium]|jgi:predicted PurR-regulated permease PerM|nr:hypothetical protein [Chitinispirillales bacterium]